MVLIAASPIAPPIWRLVFTSPEATPASARSTPARLAIVTGTKEKPRPVPPTTKAGKRSQKYWPSTGTCVSRPTEIVASARPIISVARMPIRSTTACARFEATTTERAKATNATPLCTAE